MKFGDPYWIQRQHQISRNQRLEEYEGEKQYIVKVHYIGWKYNGLDCDASWEDEEEESAVHTSEVISVVACDEEDALEKAEDALYYVPSSQVPYDEVEVEDSEILSINILNDAIDTDTLDLFEEGDKDD